MFVESFPAVRCWRSSTPVFLDLSDIAARLNILRVIGRLNRLATPGGALVRKRLPRNQNRLSGRARDSVERPLPRSHAPPLRGARRIVVPLRGRGGRDRPEAACPPNRRHAAGVAGGFNAVQKLLTNPSPGAFSGCVSVPSVSRCDVLHRVVRDHRAPADARQ